MRSVGHRAMWLCLVAVISCGKDAGTTAPSAASRLMLPEVSLSRGNREERVTGSAAILLPAFNNALEHYSISAIRHADGSVSGQFEEYSGQEGGQRIHADVYCFTVVGNTARLAARIDETNVSFGPKGSYVVWTLIDNGEGAKSPPDQTSDVFFGGTQANADTQCRTGFNLAPYFSSIRGNLQVE